MADREKQYRKANGLGLSPPPASFRDRERDRRDDRHGRLVDRSPPPPRVAGYDRDRRDREDERERLYRARGDPRGARDELNYGDEGHSVPGSERRRRRGDSDGESVDSSGRRVKRYRRERRELSREQKAKSPEVKKEEPAPEPAGVHSGSEEGEIEED